MVEGLVGVDVHFILKIQAMNDAGFPFGVVFIEVGADLIDVSVGIGLGACSIDCRIARTLGGPGGGLFAGVE